jgi:YkoY family integral membrane protein
MEDIFAWMGVGAEEALTAIFTLIIIESLLSVDNAAVLATMVLPLPPDQRARALRYGIIGAYVFRGICLLLAAVIIRIWWLKPLGGLYLLWLAYDFFKTKATPEPEDDTLVRLPAWFTRGPLRHLVAAWQAVSGRASRAYNKTLSYLDVLGAFWKTVILVEFMDLAFSIDNVLAAVAINDNLYIVMIGVFIGILAMRFVAQAFVRLMERFPFLETSAFIVIAILGLKLTATLITHFYAETGFAQFMESEHSEIALSSLTFAIFFVPVLTSVLFNFPKRAKP